MKFNFLLLFIFSLNCHANGLEERKKHLDKYLSYIDKLEFDKAAEYSAQYENIPLYKTYRSFAWFIRRNENITNRNLIADNYLRKGCVAGDYHACRREADLLRISGKLEDSEKIYIELATKYPDPASAGQLVTMYHKRKWQGFNPEKAKY